MEALLTRGAVAAIAVSEMWAVAPAARQAVVQVVDVSWEVVRPWDLNGWCRPSRRHPNRVSPIMVVSDGVHTLGQVTISTPVDRYVRDGRIRKGTVLRLHHFCCNVFRTNKYVRHLAA
jgi:enterochelin esterase-like enzyme